MQAVILCGGLGTRLRASGYLGPKILAPIGKRYFIDYLIDYLSLQECLNHVTFLTGYKHEEIEEYLKTLPSKTFDFSVLQDDSIFSGTYGSIKGAVQNEMIQEDFVSLFGDSLPGESLDSIVKAAARVTKEIVMTYISKRKVSEPPNIFFDRRSNLRYTRQSNSSHPFVDYGVYFWRVKHFQDEVIENDIKSVLEDYSKRGKVGGVRLELPFHEIGSGDALLKFRKRFDINDS